MSQRHKFNAKRTEVDGASFPSNAEAMRFINLRLLERGNAISGLRRQPRYPLHAVTPSGERVFIGEYRADFEYTDTRTGKLITEDKKGFETELFKWKRKHFQAEYGRELLVT